MAQSIDARITGLFGPQSTDDKLAEIARDLAALHDRLARALNTDVGFWTPSLPIEVDRATFDRLAGDLRFHRTNTPFDVRSPYTGLQVYCYDVSPTPAPEPIDHDILAENEPGEWATTITMLGKQLYHDFYKPNIGLTRTIYHWFDGSTQGVSAV